MSSNRVAVAAFTFLLGFAFLANGLRLWILPSSGEHYALAKLLLEPERVDLGPLSSGEMRPISITLRNCLRSPVSNISVTTSCGCTDASVEKHSLNPGEATCLTAKFHARGFHGDVVVHMLLQYRIGDMTLYSHIPIRATITSSES